MLFPFNDAEALADQVLNLLDQEGERHAMRKRAYMRGREMTWQKVACRYMESYRRAHSEWLSRPHRTFVAKTLDRGPAELPNVTIDHLQRLTDDAGILQHAVFTVPDCNEGYTTDDNARALIVSTLLEEAGEHVQTARALTHRFVGFLWHAFNRTTGRFRNFLSYDRCWIEEIGSEDSHGRALWSLGTVLARSHNSGVRGLAGQLGGLALLPVSQFTSPRAWAFSLLGIDGYLQQFGGDRAALVCRQMLLEKLLDQYRHTNMPEWNWFETSLTYANASLSHSLLVSGRAMGRDDVIEIGLSTLRWLAEIQKSEQGHFVPIGSNGFYPAGGERARFDQQPIEAAAMVSACLEAFRLTRDMRWQRETRRAFEWFLGRNDLTVSLCDPATGGCRDGLHADRANENQGAESTLAFLNSLLEMRLANNILNPPAHGKVYKIQPSPRIVSSASK